MEKVLHINWNIEGNEVDKVERYCHNCGKKVVFTDSLKRRQNANGKDIYHFAIYKCDKGHTWNMKIETFKAISGLENNSDGIKYKDNYSDELVETLIINNSQELINIDDAFETLDIRTITHERVEVKVVISDKIRLDKLLNQRLKGMSRNDIRNQIELGNIKLNDNICKYKQNVKDMDVISLDIKAMKLSLLTDSCSDLRVEGLIRHNEDSLSNRAV